ncbi:MAG: hypothetical protein K2Q01_03315, partial [Rickettsiales bacterium]|nr:hypothetical protein [Rickettsiales bacterium]
MSDILAKPQQPIRMSEEEFARELKRSLLVLTTSSPDKRDEYRALFNGLGKDAKHYAGLDLFFIDSGSVTIPPSKTAEQNSHYGKNLGEKLQQQLLTLSDPEVQKTIRAQLSPAPMNEFDPQKIKMRGMTEDSGMELTFKDKGAESRFIEKLGETLAPKLRKADKWLLKRINETGFPGPNFKPLQERLNGGFHELMTMIYDVAERVGEKDLRFTQTVNVAFTLPAQDGQPAKYFEMEPYKASGKLLTRDEYGKRIQGMHSGQAININFVQVFDGQKTDKPETVDMLIENGLHTKETQALPVEYARRDVTLYLQKLIGKRKSTAHERDRAVNISFINPDVVDHGDRSGVRTELFDVNDYKPTGVYSRAELMRMPKLRTLNGADVIVLQPKATEHHDNALRSDPNLGLLVSGIVTVETEPEAHGVHLVVDNRTGRFDKALEVISDASAKGRFPIVRMPYDVVKTDEELRNALVRIKDIQQRTPVVDKPAKYEENKEEVP